MYEKHLVWSDCSIAYECVENNADSDLNLVCNEKMNQQNVARHRDTNESHIRICWRKNVCLRDVCSWAHLSRIVQLFATIAKFLSFFTWQMWLAARNAVHFCVARARSHRQ